MGSGWMVRRFRTNELEWSIDRYTCKDWAVEAASNMDMSWINHHVVSWMYQCFFIEIWDELANMHSCSIFFSCSFSFPYKLYHLNNWIFEVFYEMSTPQLHINISLFSKLRNIPAQLVIIRVINSHFSVLWNWLNCISHFTCHGDWVC